VRLLDPQEKQERDGMRHIEDDRTAEQHHTHRLAVVGTDTFMSGWGLATGGTSYAGWAFKEGDGKECLDAVRLRGDMSRVRTVLLDDYRPRAKHTHIYVYDGQGRDNWGTWKSREDDNNA
jgi:hypothetical protein